MAYNILSQNGEVQYGVNEFVIDSPEDLKKLPDKTAMGSSALCLSNSEVYMKNSSGEWQAI